MIRVVEAISDTNIGGAGVLLVNRLMNTDLHKLETFVIIPENSQLIPRLKGAGTQVITVNACKDKSLDAKNLFKYYSVIKALSPEIVNSHGCFTARLAARMAKVPVNIYTRHCVYPTKKIYNIKLVRKIFGALTDAISDCVIAVSPAAKENLEKMGVNKKRIVTIINGAQKLKTLDATDRLRIRKSCGISPDKTVVAICARLEKCKDHKCFLEAAKHLCDISDDYRFLIIGGGSLEDSLKSMVKSLEIADKVTFTGFVDDVSPFMNIADINVNCSVGTETSSLALSEGMSLGIPCVVSNYGGNPYMVRNGENGYVYRAGDSRDLARKIQKIKDGQNYDRLSKNCKSRFERELNARAMSEKTQQLYRELALRSSAR